MDNSAPNNSAPNFSPVQPPPPCSGRTPDTGSNGSPGLTAPASLHGAPDRPLRWAVAPLDGYAPHHEHLLALNPPPNIAILLPCRNEAATIGAVVRDFRASLPQANVWVYDNASDDGTAAIATAAGAIVHHEARPGKGNVIRRMFSDIDADIYILADGDGTYDAGAAPVLVQHLIANYLDMVVGRRVEAPSSIRTAYPRGHRWGNMLLTGVVVSLFGQGSSDMLSGYRVLSRRFVKSFPASSTGFTVETEMTVHALDCRLPFDEMDTLYCDRHPDSHSKLRAIPDGLRILGAILILIKEHRPAQFFGVLSTLMVALGLVTRFAFYHALVRLTSLGFVRADLQAVFAAALLLFFAGLILDSLSRHRREIKRLIYLSGRERPQFASEQEGLGPSTVWSVDSRGDG